MNKFFLRYYLKNGNSSKINSLSQSSYQKLYHTLSSVDKVRLVHLRGEAITNLDDFELMINGRGLYDVLDDKNSLIFYIELINFVNKSVMDNGKYVKRFNIPIWKNKLEESGYLDYSRNEIYNLINRNSSVFIELLKGNDNFREMFFNNVSFEGNMYELKIDKILSNREIACYLAGQKEMKKFYNKKCCSMFYNVDESFFINLPDQFKYLIGYHPLFKNSSSKIRSVLSNYFSSFLSNDEIDDLMLLYKSDMTSDNIASLISFIINDHDYYHKFKFLSDNYFDNNFNLAVSFCKKYNETELFNSLCFNFYPEVKEKLLFLGFANRLKGIDSLNTIMDITLEDLMKRENDLSKLKDFKDDVRVFGNNDFISINYEREVIIIYSDGEVEEREVLLSHDNTIYELITENNYNYEGEINFKDMTICLASNGNIVLIVEGENIVCILPFKMNMIQKEKLIQLFERVNIKSNIELAYQENDELYALNNGISMNGKTAIQELARIKTRSKKI